MVVFPEKDVNDAMLVTLSGGSFAAASIVDDRKDYEERELLWAAIERLPSQKRLNYAATASSTSASVRPVDVRKLDRKGRELLVTRALATSEQDNFSLLSNIKQRLDRVGLDVPKVEVRFESLKVSADVHVGRRALPTLPNFVLNILDRLIFQLPFLGNNQKRNKHHLTILNDITGAIKPGRMTLLLGPPSSGKTTLLLALAGKLDSTIQKSGRITYNDRELDEFCVQRTSAYVSQTDNHIGELTVRETLDFAAMCQGASDKFAGYLKDLAILEREKGIRPNPEIDAFMKAASVKGKKHSLVTDYVLKVLGLEICADTPVGSDMIRGISGGQKKRVTTGEMIVGPRKTLFMDEISTGLDSSTTYQIIKCTRNFVHQMDATVLVSLLQPAPETFELFDDLILLSEGNIVYQGPRDQALPFFQSLGFSLPPRKAVADFLQEVTSKKDQSQYWSSAAAHDNNSRPYAFLPVSTIVEEFKKSEYGKTAVSVSSLQQEKHSANKNADQSNPPLATTKFALSRWGLLQACFSREIILLRRHRFLYIFRTCQVAFVGTVTCTMFLRTRIHPTDELNGELYMSCLFFGLVHMLFNGFSELSIVISRLPIFYKQRDNSFHPSWAFSLPSWLLRLPYSFIESFVWSCIVYFTVGFTPIASRFFRFMLLLFAVHQMALGLFRMMGAIARVMVIANTFGSAAILAIFLLGGFIVPKDEIKPWLSWAFWLSPLSYGQLAISVNEFTTPRWMKKSAYGNSTVGHNVLQSHDLSTQGSWYWIGVGVLLAYSFLFNIVFTLALEYLQPLGKAQAVILDFPEESEKTMGHRVDDQPSQGVVETVPDGNYQKEGMMIPFLPLSMTFYNVDYFVDMPKGMIAEGSTEEKRLQLLSNVSGVFRPGVLTALVGSSGAGKTTLMDVLAGRKTGGYIKGDIKISGFPKEQSSFARICGYVEQNDIHSPQVTVQESLWFSSALRLPKDVSKETRLKFVEEVMALVELDALRNALVGLPGITGLSTEQRKRLTIAVELVANPSIIFMDEPTSGLDARAAAIVIRTVRSTVDTGRTVVCTIHQPSIDIFEAFDELLLMKRGGQVIYGGPLGLHSQSMINYFQGIDGIPQIPSGYNPATWMLEISTQACEERLGRDFADIYKTSDQYREVESLIQQLSIPASGAKPLKFSSKYSQDALVQFKICYWKQNLIYWRSPLYNVVRLFFTAISALIFGFVFWNVGSKRETTKDLFLVMGALYASCLFLGVNNSTSVQPLISIERTVFYRERAAGLYSPLPYAMAQGIVEIPYIILQTIIYGILTYFMINFERKAEKFLLYLVFMFLTFTYFTFYGMMAVGLTPTQHLAAVVSSAFYSLWNLFSGFLLPKPRIPGWWIWFYYACPVSWTLRGIITSQLGDVETQLIGRPGFNGTVKMYLEESLGYDSGMVGVSVVVLIGFSLLFFIVYVVSAKVLNFQRR